MLQTRPQHKFYIIRIPPLLNGTDEGSWGISSNKPQLQKIINEGLLDIKKNGEYQKIHRKWFGN